MQPAVRVVSDARRPRAPRRMLGLVTVWALSLAGGMSALAAYGASPGAQAPAPATWPADLRDALPMAPGTTRVVMAAHPRCPCTQASIRELERIAGRSGGKLRATVLFFEPAASDAAWAEGTLWRWADAIPGVTALRDPEGRLAARFGALTSGHVVVYGADERLAFAGGITGARGHEGDNAGQAAVLELVRAGPDAPAPLGNPVFGCDLREPERAPPDRNRPDR
ncbi:MAG: RedB protein [Myxococcota bacterium]